MGCKILKRVNWPWQRPFHGRFFVGRVGLVMVSQCTKFEVSRFTRYKAMNGGPKCRKWGGLGWLGGTQGHGQCKHSIDIYDHLFDFNRNYVYLSLFSRYSRLFVKKSPILTHPTCIWHPRRGWPRSNFVQIFGVRKLESLGYHAVLFLWSCV